MPGNANKTQIDKNTAAASGRTPGEINAEAISNTAVEHKEAFPQNSIQGVADTSNRVKQLKALQRMADKRPKSVLQARAASEEDEPIQKKSSPPDLAGSLNSGIEHLSGMDISDIKAHHEPAQPAQFSKHQQQAMNSYGMQMKKVPVDSTASQFAFQLMPNPKVYQLVSSGDVAQLIYLFDRSPGSDDKKPVWSDEKKPPFSYIRSGIHNDGEHGADVLYERLGGDDLFYGISYEDDKGFAEFNEKIENTAKANDIELKEENFGRIVKIYEEKGGLTMYEVQYCKHIFGGGTGWGKYSSFLDGHSKSLAAAEYKTLNPGLPWGGGPTQIACQAAMIEAIDNGGSVRFMLNGMNDVKGIIEGTAFTGKITSAELRFAYQMLGKTVNVSAAKTIQPRDMVNVFFYVNRTLVSAPRLLELKNEQTTGGAAVAEEPAPVKGKKKSKCYITTACTTFMRLADDCEELTLLRYFRDNYLLQKPNGRALIELYYKYAPGITDKISKRKDKDEILEKLYRIIKQCVGAIKQNDNEFAFNTYCKMVMELKAQFASAKVGTMKFEAKQVKEYPEHERSVV